MAAAAAAAVAGARAVESVDAAGVLAAAVEAKEKVAEPAEALRLPLARPMAMMTMRRLKWAAEEVEAAPVPGVLASYRMAA